MKFSKAWTYRTPMKTVAFRKGDECPAYALPAAEDADVLERPAAEPVEPTPASKRARKPAA